MRKMKLGDDFPSCDIGPKQMPIAATSTSPLISPKFSYEGVNSRGVWENGFFGEKQESFLSESGGVALMDKTGPYGIGGMTLSTRLDKAGLGKESRSWLTLDEEGRKEEMAAIKASFEEGMENWEGGDHVLYAAWNYSALPQLSGKHRAAQSLMTHHTHVGRINRERVSGMKGIREEEENHAIRLATLTDADVDQVLLEANYDCSELGLRYFTPISGSDRKEGVIPETGYPRGALRFKVPGGLDVFDEEMLGEDIQSLIKHIEVMHMMVTSRSKNAQSSLNGSQRLWDQNKETHEHLSEAIAQSNKKKYPVVLDGKDQELELPLKDFPTYTMGFYMLKGELFFFVSPSFFTGGGSIEKLGMELQRTEDPDGYKELLGKSREYVRNVARRVKWELRPRTFKGTFIDSN